MLIRTIQPTSLSNAPPFPAATLIEGHASGALATGLVHAQQLCDALKAVDAVCAAARKAQLQVCVSLTGGWVV